ncbi:hypothetical protein [Jeotgalibacillus sp. S-D1]|nr:hypothetical protein [Jeotgalibacillus sp. S-D1]
MNYSNEQSIEINNDLIEYIKELEIRLLGIGEGLPTLREDGQGWLDAV